MKVCVQQVVLYVTVLRRIVRQTPMSLWRMVRPNPMSSRRMVKGWMVE